MKDAVKESKPQTATGKLIFDPTVIKLKQIDLLMAITKMDKVKQIRMPQLPVLPLYYMRSLKVVYKLHTFNTSDLF